MVNHSENFNKKKYEEILYLIKKLDEIHVEISNIIDLIKKYTSFSKIHFTN